METQRQPIEAVYSSRVRKDCLTRALVLEAVGIRYAAQQVSGGYTLVVASADAARARAELDAYDLETRDSTPAPATLTNRADGWVGVFCYAAVLAIVTTLQRQDTFALDWLAAGKADAQLIRHGELWRAVTALSLHSDLAHLAANLVFGGLFGLFAGQMLGSGLAWAGILFAGATGNLLNAWMRQAGHTSVGASTAVFAALGIIVAYRWMHRHRDRASKLARSAPLIAGVVLLAYLGTGGVRTDVAAHVTGFISGVTLGALYGRLGSRMILTSRVQFLLGIGALAGLALAWTIALKAHAAQVS